MQMMIMYQKFALRNIIWIGHRS